MAAVDGQINWTLADDEGAARRWVIDTYLPTGFEGDDEAVWAEITGAVDVLIEELPGNTQQQYAVRKPNGSVDSYKFTSPDSAKRYKRDVDGALALAGSTERARAVTRSVYFGEWQPLTEGAEDGES